MTKAQHMTMAGVALFALLSALPASGQQARDGQIRVLGRATVEAVPDQVTAQVGISNRAKTPTAALDRNSAIARRIIDFAKRFGIAEEDIQTASIQLSPVYKSITDANGESRRVLDSYNASNHVRVRLKKVERVGDFMRQALDQGATDIAGLQFGLADPSSAIDEALAKAVDDAQRKARVLAQAAKVKLGTIKEIAHPPRSEIGRGPVPMRAAPRAAAGAPVPVEAGTVTITSEVDIIWTVE
jgi:uncharacterized protein YggE